ncbi:MAG: YfcE family phosphodiesterase [Anaerolineae bacterium]|nr:YfcE family phosphodiesterase [Anaerolineae bacterium]
MLTLGVIADTHIPDRRRVLSPQVLSIFSHNRVDHILHAGDISLPSVLDQLGSIAPVSAVRGNRDWFGFQELPLTRTLTFEGVTLGLTHGHGGWRTYLVDKFNYLRGGPMAFRVIKERAVSLLPMNVDAVVFGHNHSPMNRVENGKLIFNPGSPCCPIPRHAPPSVGLLTIDADRITGEIVPLL